MRFDGTVTDYDAPVETGKFECTNSYLMTYSRIVKCSSCGLVYNNPRIKKEAAASLYRDVVDEKYIAEHEGRVRTFTRLLKAIEGLNERKGRLFDIGAYTGQFLKVAEARGWTVGGIEPSRWACEWALKNFGLSLTNGSFENYPVEPDKYDVVTMWDVLEHLYDPLPVAKKINGILKNGGLFCFSTHNIESLTARAAGSKYPFLMEMHVCHYTRDTIARLMKDSGFAVLRITPHIRILRLGYFLEKLTAYGKSGACLKAAADAAGISRLYFTPGPLGLMNIYAVKERDIS